MWEEPQLKLDKELGLWKIVVIRDGACKRFLRWSYRSYCSISFCNTRNHEVSEKTVKRRKSKYFLRPNDSECH